MTILSLALLMLAPAPPDLALYIPFDGDTSPALGALPLEAVVGQPRCVPGLRAEAAEITGDCRLRLGAPFPVEAGTIAFWLRAVSPPAQGETRRLFSVYGDPSLTDSWMRNRFSCQSTGSRLELSVFGQDAGMQWDLAAEAPALWDGDWHHVAATWEGINGPEGGGALHLSLDGQPIAERAGLTMALGRTAPVLDIGRDSDGSPEYANALIDDWFLYSRALTPEELASGVAWVRRGPPPSAHSEVPLAPVEGWSATSLPHRVGLTVPPRDPALGSAVASASLAVVEQLGALGIAGRPDPTSFRLIDAATGADVPARWSAPLLEWGVEPSAEARHYALYFAARRYDYLGPLAVAGPPPSDRSPTVGAWPADYAQSTYGDAWDFDEGDTEAIDSFGDKPSYIREVAVVDGALTAQVSEDPYIIWGSMWGPEDAGQRRVRIDLARDSLLVMRLRQSVGYAEWRILGRVAGSDQLVQYAFPVTGTDWQTVRIDLRREANWTGVLSAFRIDPTEKVEAEVAIDSVSLVPAVACTAGALETRGAPSAAIATLSLGIGNGRAVAGSAQDLTARVLDAQGAPVSGQPIVVELAGGSDGTLEPAGESGLRIADGGVRGLSDERGELAVRFTAPSGVGEGTARLLARSEFPRIDAEPVAVATVAGPPDHYEVLSPRVTVIREEESPLSVPAYLADKCGNRLSEAGRRLNWSVEEGTLEDASEATDNDGRATARLVPDTTRRWVYRVRVRDDQGLVGESGEICVLPSGPRAEPVRLGANGYFESGGEPFVPLGGFYAVWVPRPAEPGGEEGRALGAFTSASEEDIRHWFGFLQSQGVTAMRLMLRTHGSDGCEALDAGGMVNPRLFAKVLRLLDLGRHYGLRFMLTLHDDYDKPVYANEKHLTRFSLPAFEGIDLETLPAFQRRFLLERRMVSPPERYTDPDAIACQDLYTRQVVGYLRDNPALFSWELENEMVSCPAAWVNHQLEVIREVDPITPICVSHGGGGLATADPLWWTSRTAIDFYTYHLYPLGTTTPEIDYGLNADVLTRYGRMAGTCFLGESVGDEFDTYPKERDAERRLFARDLIWSSLANGNPGCFFWNQRGLEVGEFRLAREFIDRVDWTTWERRRPPIAVLVPHALEDDRYYATAEGSAAWQMMARYARYFLARGQEFDFATDPAGYEVTCDLSRFAPPEGVRPGLGCSPGFELTSLTRADCQQGLAYVRNIARTRGWEVTPGRTMYLRERAPASLRIALGLEPARVRIEVWDLDTGERRPVDLAGSETLDLGTTDHDFALLWEARE